MPAKVEELVLRLEAILFAAGKPQSVHELSEALGGADVRSVQRALRQLTTTYDGRQTSLEIRRVGDRYALQVREEFVPTAQAVTPVELPPRTIKALTLVAYHQPILQSLLARMIGEGAYEEVARLRELRLIHAEPKGATLELRTTPAFVEYFGIPSNDPEEIRRFLAGRLGVAIPGTSEGSAPTPPPEGEGTSRSEGEATDPAPDLPDAPAAPAPPSG